MKRSAIALVCGLMLAGLVSCGGDDEKAADTVPTVTTETETSPGATETTPASSTPAPTTVPRTTATPPADPDSGGTAAPRTTPAQPEDGPENDLPPEPGSPAERFERQCEQNPQTCGD